MSVPLYIKINDGNNVAIAVNGIPAGIQVMDGVVTEQDIPQAHEIAPYDVPKGDRIVRYEAVLGYAVGPMRRGQWISETVLKLPTPPSADEMTFATNLITNLPDSPVITWEGHIDLNGGYGGTRNILGISTMMQCMTGILSVAVERMGREFLPEYPNVDDIVPINYACGCGVAIDAPEARVFIRTLRSLAKHPNFNRELMMVGLGCEKSTVEMLLDEADISPENMTASQGRKGFNGMISSLMEMAEKELAKLNRRTRQTFPFSDLFIGMQCGSNDAFSGVTANPSAGYATDILAKGGATVFFSEVTEVRDGVYLLGKCCVSSEVSKKLADEMKQYDRYLENGRVGRSANPTPGSKKGGLSNIMGKAIGSIAKSGTSLIVEVLSPAEESSKKGLIYAITPASNIVCDPCQPASGIGLQMFVIGHGISYGLVVAPVIKVCSGNDMKMQWQDLIDVNAGPVATGEAAVQKIGTQSFHEIIGIASSRKRNFAEKYKLCDDFRTSNPAPIT